MTGHRGPEVMLASPCSESGWLAEPPLVTVVVPCRDEVHYIRGCVESILATRYPSERLEILVVDGMSTDGTREILSELTAAHPRIRCLDNPGGTTPAALNVGIAHASGDLIVRMDCHAEYPADYLPRLVEWQARSGADNVGGVCLTRPAGGGAVARAIATGLSHPLGVGNSYFRIGTRKPRWVDTVPFGCYPREVFDRIGLFDEELVRNQDDEFNARLLGHGGKILLVPDVASVYYARDSLRKLWRMYYQYGYYKPLVARKVGRVLTIRQTVPALFVAIVLLLSLLSVLGTPLAAGVLAAIAAAYVSAVALASAASVPRVGAGGALVLPVVFSILHLAYGLGSLRGIWDFLLRRRPGSPPGRLAPLSR